MDLLDITEEDYVFVRLPEETAFRVAEILPGEKDTPIYCTLHVTNWEEPLPYEAISYVWGDAALKEPVFVDGKRLEVTRSLHGAINHLRYTDRSRFLWADIICIDQKHNVEKGKQIGQMKRIYENAQWVLSWLGHDTDDRKAGPAMAAVKTVSDFLCKELDLNVDDLKDMNNMTEYVFKHRKTLPDPDKTEFSSDELWSLLRWFYSIPYFTRVWVIQEVNANRNRTAHCGYETLQWDLVELVAGYIIMETDFSRRLGFTKTNVWWAATTTELKRPDNWLTMLYLASNYGCLDPRDIIYGLRGLMQFTKGAELLTPDYDKTTLEVYRDSVEAALVNFENTDVLLYVTGIEVPSWIPAWNVGMMFRNPFRFGNRLPWKPAGDTKAIWSIDKSENVLSIDGFIVGTIKAVHPHWETYFGTTKLTSEEGQAELKIVWKEVLGMIEETLSLSTPFDRETLNAAATTFSFGLNETSLPAAEVLLLHRFVAYLKIVLEEEIFQKYVSEDMAEEAAGADGLLFGKPVWDFTYPEASFLITDTGLMGCCVSTSQIGDVVVVPLGSTYPHVMRPVEDDNFVIRGFTFIYGIMNGEKADTSSRVIEIR
ncbi:hypothetical protein H072_5133 [Dactylellina haptotyla CBS 200.50]|uniref:Heterokaryon incompatibility domain-containing protein n=1 Tax=Dactylellina haptotyla (strain CBS 200.50) TaxID=1284197 RepID=S8AIL8_DACHA|nr:hypothetical protein H072_5133 [Dactylellina haptotyla CBS 200.50]